MFCSKCGTEISDEAVVCVHCGCAVTPAQSTVATPVSEEDKVSIGFCILSFLVPLFGIISWVASFVFSIIFTVIYYLIFFTYLYV